MNKQISFLFFALLTISCSTIKSPQSKCYKNSKTTLSIKWSESFFVDTYIKLKKGNYFNYYQRLIGSHIKQIEYCGSYSQLDDTLFFKFCGDTIPKIFTERALIDNSKNEIILLAANPRLNRHFKIRFEKW